MIPNQNILVLFDIPFYIFSIVQSPDLVGFGTLEIYILWVRSFNFTLVAILLSLIFEIYSSLILAIQQI